MKLNMNALGQWLSQRGCFWLQKSVVLIQSSTFFLGGAIITQEHLYLKLFISSMTFGRRQNAFSWLVWTLVLTLLVNNQTSLANLITCRVKQHPLFWCIHEHFFITRAIPHPWNASICHSQFAELFSHCNLLCPIFPLSCDWTEQ